MPINISDEEAAADHDIDPDELFAYDRSKPVWHDSPHEEGDPCDGCSPNTGSPRYDDDEEVQVVSKDAPALFTKLNTRTIGYHFGPLTFRPGRDGVRDVLVGDPGIPGVISVKVTYKGTGKRPSIFTVPIALMVLEEEELPIEIVSSLKGVK